jgi:hypothetical protein
MSASLNFSTSAYQEALVKDSAPRSVNSMAPFYKLRERKGGVATTSQRCYATASTDVVM